MTWSIRFLIVAVGLFITTASIASETKTVEISADVLEDKIRGGLLAEIIGNLNGLPHEMKYIAEPGKVEHYTPSLPDGAVSDDDTDIEWVYITAMEKTGKLLLSPKEISELWQRHINRRIWCANDYARQLMWIHIDPPLTGKFALNPWSDFNISGQFICESFGLISPGMPRTAEQIGLHYTHVTIEGEPAQQTQLFTAMIATAFFEDDLDRILDAGLSATDHNSVVHRVVKDVRRWHEENPQDWKKTRMMLRDKYTHFSGEMRDRNGYELNTGAAVAALLYARGDFVETLRLAFNFGWDADCDGATCATVVGVMRGRKWMDAQGWNIRDVYKNISRDDMPMNETITSFGSRLVHVAAQVIRENGGEELTRNGKRYYRIRRNEPAVLEKLPSFEQEREELKASLLPRIEKDLADDDPRARAGAAYLAICLDHALELEKTRPDAWKRAMDALRQYDQVGDALFRAAVPAAEPLRAKARAAGLELRKR